jgi:outer membrane lipoprotein-sorting protein
MKRYLIVIILSLCFLQTKGQIFQNMSVEAHSRKAHDGKVQSMELKLYYSTGGTMVSYYEKPDNIVILNDEKGQVSIYDESSNTVLQSNNSYYSSKSNQLYYFLSGDKSDLGLSQIGFTLDDTRYEDGMIITEWIPPMQGLKFFSRIKMVHEQDKPIYMEYIDPNGSIVKKIYFYNYERIKNIDLPKSITQIDFKNEQDSIISKTTYQNFQFDSPVIEEKLSFKVPYNAKTLK